MNCENCGIEHNGTYASGRFCSKKCSKGFSTKAKRKEINEKISTKRKLETKKINKCKSCDAVISKRKKLCADCKIFFKYKTLFHKLNINDFNIKLANEKAKTILYNEYFINNLSLGQIREKYNLQFNTVYFFMKKNKFKLRNYSMAGEMAYETGRLSPAINFKYKTGWHNTWNNKKVYLRSSYELNFAKQLDNKHIDYEVEFKRIKYFDSVKQKFRIAIPDFFIIKNNTIVEIKSSWTLNLQNMKDKFNAYKELGYSVILNVNGKEINID